jgi:hypothetical protein
MMNVEGNDIIDDNPAMINTFIKEYRIKFFWEKRVSSMGEAFRLYNRGQNPLPEILKGNFIIRNSLFNIQRFKKSRF